MVSTFPSKRDGPPVVVCVDDDPNILSAMKRLLRREPLEVLTTDKPSTALRWIGNRKVDLLITDLKMPEMSGADLIKIVEERSPDTESVLLTGYPERAAEASGPPVRLIPKPWNDAEFKETIRSLVVPAQAARKVPGLVPGGPSPRMRVLLVDADEGFRSVAARALGPEGFDLEVAGSAGEALERIVAAETPVELAILQAGCLEGGEDPFVRLLRRLAPGLYVIAVVGPEARQKTACFYQAGATQVLAERPSPERLADLLKRCVPHARRSGHDAREQIVAERRRQEDRWYRRALRWVRSTLRAPSRSRRGQFRGLFLQSACALAIGAGLAGATGRVWALLSPSELLSASRPGMDRLWSLMSQDQSFRHWYQAEQLELSHQTNEETRRYHDQELFERRWEGVRPRRPWEARNPGQDR